MKQLRAFPRFVEVITLIGLILYVAQSWQLAHSLDSIADESAYLYKGYMFARGDYHPFQEYAFWTNKAPLAFLIPGYIQLWFGPGLREARYFAIAAGILMMIGIWITAQRLGGKTWAALAVWIFAVSSPQIIIYSEAVSQVLVSCMLAWMLVLTLGEDRKLWQLVAGSALSIVIVMTRQNLAVVPVFLVLYIFWQYGKKAGLWALATCTIFFIAFHAYYWPDILQLWAPWLPDSLTPFLDPFRVPDDPELRFSAFQPSVWSSLQSFAGGMRDNFFIFFGSVGVLALFPKRHRWRSDSHFKAAVFLGITFLVLFIMHTLASLFIPHCVYCFSGYQTFYSVIGLFFVLVILMNGLNEYSLRQTVLMGLVLLFFAGVLGLYYNQLWGPWFLDHVGIPRLHRLVSGGDILVSLRDVFTYSMDMEVAVQRRAASIIGGVLLGSVLLIVLGLLYRFVLQRYWTMKYSLANTILICCLVLGTLFPFMSSIRSSGSGACAGNYLSYYESAGQALGRAIPPGSLVYLGLNGKERALMLYVYDIRIFPPQIHGGAGYAVGDTQGLYKMGLYNEELDKQWQRSADVLILGKSKASRELLQFLEQQHYEQLPYDMGKLAQCEESVFVFRRTQ